MKLEDFILTTPNVLSTKDCDAIIDLVGYHFEYESSIGDFKIDKNIRNALEYNVSTSKNHQCIEIHKHLSKVTLAMYEYYRAGKRSNFSYFNHLPKPSEISIESFRIKHYKKDIGFFSEHTDDVGKRLLAIIFYLNTVDVGGETRITSLNLNVEPEIGKCLMFPTTWQYPHEGCMPLSEDKYIIQGYINDERH